MAKNRKRYTERERARILSAAASKGLTGKQAAKKFGVTPWTLWSWRKKATAPREQKVRRRAVDASLASMIRAEVQARIRAILPGVVHEEIASCLQQALGGKRRVRV